MLKQCKKSTISSMTSTYDPAEADEWIEKVNRVKQAIGDLGTNKPGALRHADKLLIELNADKIRKQTEVSAAKRKSDINKQQEKYRKGDGWKNEYKLYCNNCFTEILIHTDVCPRCNYSKLISRKQRRNILQDRVNKLKQEYEMKEIRRKRWEEYRNLHAKHHYNLTNYDEWELWEDEIDWNDYMDDNYIPEDNVAAKQMAFDMKQRAEKRANEMKAAIKEKNEGNKYLKEKKYSLKK